MFNSLADVIESWAEDDAAMPVMTFMTGQGDDRTYTRGELYKDVMNTADRFIQMGVGSGEHIILSLPNSYALVCGFFGAIFSGAIPAIFPFNSVRTLPVVCRGLINFPMVKEQGARIFTTSRLIPDLSAHLAEYGVPVHSIDEICAEGGMPLSEYRPSLYRDSIYMQLSSGTTGMPKGVYISHKRLLRHIAAVAQAFSWASDDISVGWAPFSHELGLIMQVLLPTIAGGCSVNIETHRWLAQPYILPQTIHRCKGTVCFMPNFGIAHTSQRVSEKDLTGIDLSSLRIMGNGSEPIRIGSFQSFEQRYRPHGFRPEGFVAAYGMAENTGAITVTPLGKAPAVDWVASDELHKKQKAVPQASTEEGAIAFVSCGKAIAGTAVRIVDQDGNTLPDRFVGEIFIKGSSLFTFYLNGMSQSTRDKVSGWFPTGDIGYLVNGQLFVCDRKQDVIIAGGVNLYPDSIEAVAWELMKNRARGVVAFGVPEATLGTERPVLVCETNVALKQPEQEFFAKEIHRTILKKLGVVLTDVRFVRRGWIVKSTSGKLDRNANRLKYEQCGYQISSQTAILASQETTRPKIEEALTALFQKRLGLATIGAWDNFFDYGIDSILFLDLFTSIEETFCVALPLEKFLELPTIEHMAWTIYDCRKENHRKALKSNGDRSKATYDEKPDTHFVKCRSDRKGVVRNFNQGGWFYALFSRAIHRFINCGLVGGGLVTNSVRQLKTFHAFLQPSIARDDFIRRSLINNSLINWRLRYLSMCSPSVFFKWVSVEGLETLKAAFRKGGGVVLLQSHFAMHQIVLSLLFNEGFNDVSIIGYNESLQNGPIGDFVKGTFRNYGYSQHLSTIQLIHARKALCKGGMVAITADGEDGHSGLSLPFFGRMYPFRAGFAELALQTGALPVPVITTLKETGHLKVQFLSPLDVGFDLQFKQNRLENLIIQYQCLLKWQWEQMPYNILWYYMQRFMALPAVSGDGS